MGIVEMYEPNQVRTAIRDVDSALAAGATPTRDAVLILRDVARDLLRANDGALECPLEHTPGPDEPDTLDDPLDDTPDPGSPRARTRRSPRGGAPLDDDEGFTEPPGIAVARAGAGR